MHQARNNSLDDGQSSLNEVMDQRESTGYQVYPGTEADQFDFTAERQLMHGTNLIESTVHLVKGCVGAGLLSVHVGYMYAGIWIAAVMTVVLGILVSYNMTMLIKSAQTMYVRLRVPKLSYSDLAEASLATSSVKRLRLFSKAFRYLVDACVVAEMCLSCCIYEIMIATTLKQFLESICKPIQEMNLDLRYYILIVGGPLIVMSLIRNLKYLAPFSFLADIIVVMCVLVSIYYSLTGVGKISERLVWKSFRGLIDFCGVCLYCMDGIILILPVENNMRKPKYFFIVLQYGMITVVALLIATGLLGYWGWGEQCKSPVIIQMPAEVVPSILQLLIVFMLSITFAVHFWVPFRVIWFCVRSKHDRKQGLWERFYRMLLVLIIIGISFTFPHLMKIMIFVGNFFIGSMAFIFPAVIECLVVGNFHVKRKMRWVLFKNIVIVLLGVFFCSAAFYSAIDVYVFPFEREVLREYVIVTYTRTETGRTTSKFGSHKRYLDRHLPQAPANALYNQILEKDAIQYMTKEEVKWKEKA